jgi:hypothetical protein
MKLMKDLVDRAGIKDQLRKLPLPEPGKPPANGVFRSLYA